MSPLDTARRAFTYYFLGDKPGILTVIHPEGVWTFPGDPALVPWAGTWHGLELTRLIDLFIDHLDYQEVRVERFDACGERVYVQAFERYVVRATGRMCDNRLLGVFTVRGGRVHAYEEYSDTGALERAMR